MTQTESTQITIGPRHLRDDAEFDHLHRLRQAAFTPWNFPPVQADSPLAGRHAMNAIARLYPEFFLQARDTAGVPLAYLMTLPTHWDGDPSSLMPLDHYNHSLRPGNRRLRLLGALQLSPLQWAPAGWLFDLLSAGHRRLRLEQCNAIVLTAIIIDPQHRGQQVPALMFNAIRDSARRLGFKYVISPFRPSGYGQFKQQRQLAHSEQLFAEYCASITADGDPLDPWLRALTRNGVSFMRPVPRSMSTSGSLDEFERLKSGFRAGQWYSPQADVWECGLTPTWYVDRDRATVTSIEPNVWGQMPLDPASHPVAKPTASIKTRVASAA